VESSGSGSETHSYCSCQEVGRCCHCEKGSDEAIHPKIPAGLPQSSRRAGLLRNDKVVSVVLARSLTKRTTFGTTGCSSDSDLCVLCGRCVRQSTERAQARWPTFGARTVETDDTERPTLYSDEECRSETSTYFKPAILPHLTRLGEKTTSFFCCHCEKRSDEAIHLRFPAGLPQSPSLLRNDKLCRLVLLRSE